jgi:hypothetical protein
MKIKKILGIFGFVYVGLSLYFLPSFEPETVFGGFSALERITQNEEFQEDGQKIHQLVFTMIMQGKQIARAHMISLGVIFILSIFLVRESKSEPDGTGQPM